MSLILYASADFLIADKPHGMPTVPLKSRNDGNTLLDCVSEQYPQVLAVCGKNSWEGGALHRLDTATGGLVVFALSQSFYDKVSVLQNEGAFLKTYVAHVTDNVFFEKKTVKTYFRAYGPHSRIVKCETDSKRADSPVLYETRMKKLTEDGVECEIYRGFRHQIRAHLAYIGLPIAGDELYGSAVHGDILQLECVGVEFDGFRYRKAR